PGHRMVALPMVDPRSGRVVSMRQQPGLDSLLSLLAKDGIEAQDIGLIINTHAHSDHCESSPLLAQKSGALIALHPQDEESYLNQMKRSYPGKDTRLEPDLYLEEGELRLGSPTGPSLKVVHTPGHSPGSVSLYWPERKALMGGDVMFYRNTGRFDLPGGDLETLRQSVARLSELDVEWLLCGHPYGHSGIIKGRKEVRDNFSFVLRLVLA
ncbi:MAG: MBL fold metallo-hydrolase, partial [Chloroflexota bacterium]|nr:MBL fold metallo-hydrolase [Chloroflexota bacterium]